METQNIPTPVSGFSFGPETPVGLTELAVKKVRETIEEQKLEGHLLRIAVVSGGCSGYNYDLDLVREPGRPTSPTSVAASAWPWTGRAFPSWTAR